MQENKREISTLKQRILYYLDFKGISKYECYQKTGMSRSVLSQSNGITEDNLLRFINYYQDINPEWLLTGLGEMLRSNAKDNIHIDHSFVGHDVIGKVMGNVKHTIKTLQPDMVGEIIVLRQQLEAKEQIIVSLRQQLNGQKQLLEAKDEIIAMLKNVKN